MLRNYMLILMLVLLVACTHSGSRLQPQPSDTEPGGLIPGLQSPADIAQRVSSDLVSQRNGAAFDTLALQPNHVEAAGQSALYKPQWDAAGSAGPGDMAYALYAFELPGYSQCRFLHNSWLAAPAVADFWIALGNQDKQTWDWFAATPGEQFVTPDLAPYLTNSDMLLAIVALTGTEPCMLEWIGFEGSPPDVLSVTPIQGEPGTPTTFNADVVGTPPFTYAWDFGGAAIPNTSSDESPQVIFGTVGKYDASVTVTNELGVDTLDFALYVGVPIIVQVSPTWGISGQEYSFTATVFSTQPVTYAWAFGGCGIPDNSDQSAPLITLGASGEYAARLTVLNSYGADNFDFALTVKEPPVANLEAVPTTGIAPLEVSMDASGSYDPDGSIILFEWDWDNDGIFEDETGTNPLTSHIYSAVGEYNPTVRVTDNEGGEDTMSDVIWVVPDQVANVDATDGVYPHQVVITWDQVTSADGYMLQYKNNEGGTPSDWTNLATVNDGTTTSFDHTADSPMGKENVYDTIFEYRAKATYEATESMNWSATDTGYSLLVDVSGLSATDGAGQNIVRVTWDQVTGADGYKLQYKDNEGGSPIDWADLDTVNDGLTLSFSHTEDYPIGKECAYNTVYEYRAKATYNAHESLNWSATDTGFRIAIWFMFGHDLKHTRQSKYNGPSTNNVKWSYPTGGVVYSSPAIGEDGTVYVGSRDNKLYAINPDGSLKWSYATGDQVISSPAIGADGTVYFGSRDNKVYALNPVGSLKWAYTTGGDIDRSSPTIGDDGTVYIGSADYKLHAINPDGTTKGGHWPFTTGDIVYSSPAIGADGTVYVGSDDYKLYAIKPDGTKKWSYTTGKWVRSSPAIGVDGTVYVGSYDDNLYAINPDGTKKWFFAMSSLGVLSSPAIGADGTVYVGSYDNNLYAINPDGTEKWSFPTELYVLSSPAIGSDGTVYVGSWDCKFYAINPVGTLLWSYTTGIAVDSSPAIGVDGVVFVQNHNKLYAFGPTT